MVAMETIIVIKSMETPTATIEAATLVSGLEVSMFEEVGVVSLVAMVVVVVGVVSGLGVVM